MQRRGVFVIGVIAALLAASLTFAGGKWYNYYRDGLKATEQGNWSQAIANFKEALNSQNTDAKKVRTYGMHFIEYFPHREIGICYYHLGNLDLAQQHLEISLRQEYSARAQDYLAKIKTGERPVQPTIVTPPPEEKIPPVKEKPIPAVEPKPVEPAALDLVGERMSLAVLRFETKGLGEEMGEIDLIDKLITELVSLGRFKVMERSQIQKVWEEQKLGQTGVLDASTAAEIGKGIGVDAIMLGSVTRSANSVGIDARIIDTESAEIMAARDEYSPNTSIQNIKQMIEALVLKIRDDFPLTTGFVIKVDGDRLTLDLGTASGVKKGMKCIVYREGEEMIHPITGKSLGKQKEELGQIRLTEVYAGFSVGKVIRSTGVPIEVGNKVITR